MPATKSSLCSPQLEKACAQQQRPSTTKKIKLIKERKRHYGRLWAVTELGEGRQGAEISPPQAGDLSQPCVVFTPRSRMAGRSRVSEREEDPVLTSFNKFVQRTFVLGLLTETHQLFGTSTAGSHARYITHQLHGHRQVTSFLSQFPHPENEYGHPLYVQLF